LSTRLGIQTFEKEATNIYTRLSNGSGTFL
jgi:hypothetical protein